MKNDGMDEMNIREYLENHKLLTDGAMGTYFDTVEKENYICSEEANITNPSLVRQIHKNYVKNGAQLLRSNTFLANRETLLSLQQKRAEQYVDIIDRYGVDDNRSMMRCMRKLAIACGMKGRLLLEYEGKVTEV